VRNGCAGLLDGGGERLDGAVEGELAIDVFDLALAASHAGVVEQVVDEMAHQANRVVDVVERVARVAIDALLPNGP
jgi:hypothetical protein